MAAIVSGIFSALYVRFQQRWNGFIRKNQWHPGRVPRRDPRLGARHDHYAMCPHDLYARHQVRIVAALERGAPPWVRPWSQDVDTMPVNAAAGAPTAASTRCCSRSKPAAHGYPLNRWLTYRQAWSWAARCAGARRGTTVVLWRLRKVAATADIYPEPEAPDLHERVIPLLRATPCSTWPRSTACRRPWQPWSGPHWEPEARAEELLLMSGGHHPPRRLPGVLPPGDDYIQLRHRGAFAAPALLRHGAARADPLDRTPAPGCTVSSAERFGDEAYAAEELIAELGSAFLCAHCRVEGELQHASYVSTGCGSCAATSGRSSSPAPRRRKRRTTSLPAPIRPQREPGGLTHFQPPTAPPRARLHFTFQGTTMDNYFARLNQINVNDHVEKKGQFSYLQLALRRGPAAAGRPGRVLGGPSLRRPAVPQDRGRVLRRGRRHRTGRHPVPDPPGAGRQEPADLRADRVRHQHQPSSAAGQGHRVARPRPVHLRREDLPEGETTDDEPPHRRPRSPRSPVAGVTAAQIRYIERLIDETGSDLAKVLDYFGVASLTELTRRQRAAAIKSLEKQRRAA